MNILVFLSASIFNNCIKFINKLKIKAKPLKISLINKLQSQKMIDNVPILTWKKLPDERARGIIKLDRNLFTFKLNILILQVPFSSIGFINIKFKDLILKCPRLSEVKIVNQQFTGKYCDAISSNFKSVLLDPNKCLEVKQLSQIFQDDIIEFLNNYSVQPKQQIVEFYYQNWLYDEIIREILPTDISNVAGFSTIGHIAHMNLRDEHLKYKYIIGEVILDKVTNVKTVVNKINTIDNTYRNFQMELLAGENNYVTNVKEHGFTYELDFSKVYWNSRLSTEHHRITNMIPQSSIVFDVFAGVGPFSVPLAKKGCTIFANDLNPDSYFWLGKNLKLNKAKESHYQIFNLDGREFIETVVKNNLLKFCQEKDSNISIHIIMNLPALACTFLKSFIQLLPSEFNYTDNNDNRNNNLIGEKFVPNINLASNINFENATSKYLLDLRIHCYCFSKGSKDPLTDAKSQVESILCVNNLDNCEVRIVRNVAPNKEMVYVGFQLPENILISPDLINEPISKRIRTK